jgi:hypothetical protein
VERKAQETALAAARDPGVDVQERSAGRPAGDRPDVAGLLDHEEAPGAIAGIRQEDRLVVARSDRQEGEVDGTRLERGEDGAGGRTAGRRGEERRREEQPGRSDPSGRTARARIAPDQRQDSGSKR